MTTWITHWSNTVNQWGSHALVNERADHVVNHDYMIRTLIHTLILFIVLPQGKAKSNAWLHGLHSESPCPSTGWFDKSLICRCVAHWSAHWSAHWMRRVIQEDDHVVMIHALIHPLQRIHASPIDLLCSWTMQRMGESMSRWFAHCSTHWSAHWQY